MTPEAPGVVLSVSSTVVSPSELLKRFIDDNADPEMIPAGAVVGGADDDQQNAGVAALMDAGNQKNELYAPLLWKRVQVRVMGPTLDRVDDMGNYLFELLHDQRWLELEDSRGRVWFVHSIYMSTGPSQHVDSVEAFENLMFAVVCVGRTPVSTPPVPPP